MTCRQAQDALLPLQVLFLPGPDPGPAVSCSVFQALIQFLYIAESCTCHSLHKPTFGPNATEQYVKLLLGMCAAAVRVSRETFVSVTPSGLFVVLIFLSRDSHSLAKCSSAWGPGESPALWNCKHLLAAGELPVCGEKQSIPLPAMQKGTLGMSTSSLTLVENNSPSVCVMFCVPSTSRALPKQDG